LNRADHDFLHRSNSLQHPTSGFLLNYGDCGIPFRRIRWRGVVMPTRKASRKSGKRWIAKVTTDSTHPTKGLFTKDAATIARSLASKRVSPKGPVSGLRMLDYFINRGGKGLPATRRRTLERAKAIMMQRLHGKNTNHSSRSKRAG
jgi:tRNA(adenine34) deaminase